MADDFALARNNLERNHDSSVYTEVPAAYVDLLKQHLTVALKHLQESKATTAAAEEISICLKILEILQENFHPS
jgi:hypothetical protein